MAFDKSLIYNLVFLFGNIFGTYIVYMFINVFYHNNKRIRRRYAEVFSYIVYFFIIELLYIYINKPIINLLYNLFALFLLTYNYKDTLQKRIVISLMIYVILLIIESCTVLIFTPLRAETQEGWLIICIITSKIFTYIFVIYMERLAFIKNGTLETNSHLISTILIPFGSIIIFQVLTNKSGSKIGDIICLIALFLFNILVFYFYNEINKSYQKKMDIQMLSQQNIHYKKQLEFMQKAIESVQSFQHDFKNYNIAMKGFIENGNKEGALNYIGNMVGILNSTTEYANSQNIDIDSILNYKMAEAEMKNIQINLKLNIPINLNILSTDLSIIFGNLIDNAIEAAILNPPNFKYVNLEIRYDRGVLHLYMENPYFTELKYKKGVIVTSKIDKNNHGFGLRSINNIVNKYNGDMVVRSVNNLFTVNILLYDDAKS